MAVDLGQSADPTAFGDASCARAARTIGRSIKQRTTRQRVDQTFDIVHAERMPLGTPYPDVVDHVRDVPSRPPLRDKCYFVIDETGVGRAVGDYFEEAGMRAVRVANAGRNRCNPAGQRSEVGGRAFVS